MRHDPTISLELKSVLRRAGDLLSVAESAPVVPSSDLFASAADMPAIVEAIAGAALFSLRQFEVMLGTVSSPAAALQLIPLVIDRAEDYRCATSEAVGVAATLVDLVRSHDSVLVVDTALSACAVLGESDVAEGLASFMASLSAQVGTQIDIDADLVHDEFCNGFSVEALSCDVPVRVGAHRS